MAYFTHLLQHSDASGSKSTILKPLNWLLISLASILITLTYIKAPVAFIYIIFGLLVITFVLIIGTYIYCLRKNPDALRSETFSIQKMALEKGVYGDSTSGTFVVEEGKEMAKLSIGMDEEKPDDQ